MKKLKKKVIETRNKHRKTIKFLVKFHQKSSKFSIFFEFFQKKRKNDTKYASERVRSTRFDKKINRNIEKKKKIANLD